MGKIQIEICLISARGLRRLSSFWKLQWYAVGWIDPANKYCTKIDASGSGNPVWNTRFSAAIDPSELDLRELVLHVEVYSREPVFLRQSLFGSATVVLKEFLEKYRSPESEEARKVVEEVGSFQLRKKKSDKAVGFVDVSIRVSEDREEPGWSKLGPEEGFDLSEEPGEMTLASTGSLHPTRPPQTQIPPFPPNYHHHHHHHPPGEAYHPSTIQHSYQPPQTPSFPPLPHAGYGPYFAPAASSSYINMPASVAPPGHGAGPRLGMGAVAAGGAVGAVAAGGGVVWADDLVSGFHVSGTSLDASFNV